MAAVIDAPRAAKARERSRIWRDTKRGGPPPPPKTLEDRFWAKVQKANGCWLWTAYKTPDGYGKVGTAASKCTSAHRVSWELTHGPIPAGMLVCHHCDNPSCVRPEHLFLGTDADNTRDRDEKGRQVSLRGAQNANAKLTSRQVRAILAGRERGMTYDALAEKYGVGKSTVHRIVRRMTWRHI